MMMAQIKQFVLVLVTMFSMVILPAEAHAYTILTCNDTTGLPIPGTTLFDADPINDPTTHTGECQYNGMPILQHIFSYVICDFTQIVNAIMDAMYCGINFYLRTTIRALVTLYLTVYGAQILMGTAQVSTRDGVMRMLKLSVVVVFATKSAYGINLIFRFFIGFIAAAGTAILSVLGTFVAAQNDTVCDFPGLDPSNIMSMFDFLDYLVCHSLIGPMSTASTKVQGLFLALIVTLPPAWALFQWWLMTTVRTLVMTLVGYLKALAVISFLVTLSPLFIGFYLFQSTAYIFENWLRYLISFSVQMVIILAIIVFWIMAITTFIDFFNELAKLIFSYKPVNTVEAWFEPSNTWGICPPKYGTNPTNNEPTAVCDKDSKGRVFNATPPTCPNPPIVPGCLPFYPGCKCPPVWYWWQDNQELIPPDKIIDQGEFLFYVFYHIFTLILICYCFSELLQKANEIAKQLAGPASIPSLVPGWGNNLGNVNSFKRPAFLGTRPGGDSSAKNTAADFHRMVGNRNRK